MRITLQLSERDAKMNGRSTATIEDDSFYLFAGEPIPSEDWRIKVELARHYQLMLKSEYEVVRLKDQILIRERK